MVDNATIRLNKVLRELNISLDRAVDFLGSKGHDIDARPTTKISNKVYQVLLDEFQTDMSKKVASKEVGEEKRKEKEALRLQLEQEQEEKKLAREKQAEKDIVRAKVELPGPKTVGKIDLDGGRKTAQPSQVKEEKKEEPVPEKMPETHQEKAMEEVVEKIAETPKVEAPEIVKTPIGEKDPAPKTEQPKAVAPKESEEKPAEEAAAKENEVLETKYQKLTGPKIMGDKIDLTKFEKPKKKKEVAKTGDAADKKKRRKRIIAKPGSDTNKPAAPTGSRGPVVRRAPGQRFATAKQEPTEEDVQKQVRETLEK